MRLLTVCTEQYEKQLRIFMGNAPVSVRNESRVGLLYSLRCAYEPAEFLFADALADFLENLILYENPVYRHSPKMRNAAGELRRTAVHTENREQLRLYLAENKSLHVEGYTAFRMAEYRYRLDMLMYGLIKRLRLTEQ
jgi:hypothetical protein